MEKKLQLTENSRKPKALTPRCIYCSQMQRTSPGIILTALSCLSQELPARSIHLQLLKEGTSPGWQPVLGTSHCCDIVTMPRARGTEPESRDRQRCRNKHFFGSYKKHTLEMCIPLDTAITHTPHFC